MTTLRAPRRWRAIRWVIVAIVLWPFVGAMVIDVRSADEVSHRHACRENLKRLGIAFHAYHDRYHSFPPTYILDANGKPMHSWRVLLLPFLGRQDLYDQYHFDEPWDGPRNRRLAARIPDVYHCPGDSSANREHTSYVGVVSRYTAWVGAQTPTRGNWRSSLKRRIGAAWFWLTRTRRKQTIH